MARPTTEGKQRGPCGRSELKEKLPVTFPSPPASTPAALRLKATFLPTHVHLGVVSRSVHLGAVGQVTPSPQDRGSQLRTLTAGAAQGRPGRCRWSQGASAGKRSDSEFPGWCSSLTQASVSPSKQGIRAVSHAQALSRVPGRAHSEHQPLEALCSRSGSQGGPHRETQGLGPRN